MKSPRNSALVRRKINKYGWQAKQTHFPAGGSCRGNGDVCRCHEFSHIACISDQPNIAARRYDDTFQQFQIWVASADHDNRFQPIHLHVLQGVDDFERGIARITAAERHQEFASNWRNLAFPLPPLSEFAAQHGIARTQQKPGLRISIAVEARIGMRVLIEHKVRVVALAVPVIVDKEKLEPGGLQQTLILGTEMIAVDYDPTGTLLLRELDCLLRIVWARWENLRPEEFHV